MPELRLRRQTVSLIHSLATEHNRWLDHLCDEYGLPRSELVRMLSAKGALEYEIARLISKAALSKAREMIKERERPDEDSPDLFDRAVYGHWRRLRDAEIARSVGAVAELKQAMRKD